METQERQKEKQDEKQGTEAEKLAVESRGGLARGEEAETAAARVATRDSEPLPVCLILLEIQCRGPAHLLQARAVPASPGELRHIRPESRAATTAMCELPPGRHTEAAGPLPDARPLASLPRTEVPSSGQHGKGSRQEPAAASRQEQRLVSGLFCFLLPSLWLGPPEATAKSRTAMCSHLGRKTVSPASAARRLSLAASPLLLVGCGRCPISITQRTLPRTTVPGSQGPVPPFLRARLPPATRPEPRVWLPVSPALTATCQGPRERPHSQPQRGRPT